MAKIGLATSFALATSLALASMAMAQTAPPEGMPHGGGFGPGRDLFRILGGEGGHPGKVVVGAPFSGKQVTTDTQTLSNGTHITHTSTVQIYRDASGRVRTERTFSGVGPWSSGEPKTIIDIFDPVAGVSYMLNPTKQTATKRTIPAARTGASSMSRPERPVPASETVNTTTGEPTMVAGMACTPTTTVRTIAANTFGNDQAITTSETRCYSSELQMNISSSRMDPRMGQVNSTFEVLTSGAPDASLFAPPSNYTVSTAVSRRTGGAEGPGVLQ